MTSLQPAADPKLAFQALRQHLRAAGYEDRPTGRMLIQLGVHLCIMALGFAGVILLPLPYKALGFAVLIVGTLGEATTVHTASHRAFSHRRWVNEAVTFFGYPFVLGLSATYWHHRHVQLHHAHPNVVDVDQDIEQLPWFALTERNWDRVAGWMRPIYRLQWLYWPVLVALNGIGMQLDSIKWVIRSLLDPGARRKRHVGDLLCLIGHYVAWLAIPSIWLPFWQVLLFHLLWASVEGIMLFATFVPAHWPHEAACLVEEGDDFVLRQTATTVNFRTNPVSGFFIAGLQYQIEHHLLPSVAHAHYPAVSERVRAFCEEHGYPYRTFGWGEALGKAIATFRAPKPVLPQPSRE